jgi:flagellar motility protein MotE (MotC chaperone)
LNKKLIIITAVAGIVSFGGMFAAAWFLKKPVEVPLEASIAQSPDDGAEQIGLEKPALPAPQASVSGKSVTSQTMSDKELKNLIYEVREKIADYNGRLESLKIREDRIAKSQEMIKGDIEELEGLRVELASTVLSIKDEQDKLLKNRVNIEAKEEENLISIATTYDKMDAESAAKILTNMNQVENDSANDAIKILHYMSERTKADVLAAIAEIEPSISAFFCNKLKQVVTKE